MDNLKDYCFRQKFIVMLLEDVEPHKKGTIFQTKIISADTAQCILYYSNAQTANSIINIPTHKLSSPIEPGGIQKVKNLLKRDLADEEYKRWLIKEEDGKFPYYRPTEFTKMSLGLDRYNWYLYQNDDGDYFIGVNHADRKLRQKLPNRLQVDILSEKFRGVYIKVGESHSHTKYPGVKFYRLYV